MKMANKNVFFMYLMSKKSELVLLGVLVGSNEGTFDVHNITTEDELKMLGHLSEDEKLEEQHFLLCPATVDGVTKNRHFKILSEKDKTLFREIDFCELRDSRNALLKNASKK